MYNAEDTLKRIPELAVWAAIAIVAVMHAYRYVTADFPDLANPMKSNPRLKIAMMVLILAFVIISTIVDVDNSNANSNGKTSESVPALAQDTAVAQVQFAVKDAQMWRFFVLFTAPQNCDATNMQRYFLTGSPAFVGTGETASLLSQRHLHYGSDAKLIEFNFRYTNISQDGLSAQVGTREHWYLPLYSADNKPIAHQNADRGPYDAQYLLINVHGQWYLKDESQSFAAVPQEVTCSNWPS